MLKRSIRLDKYGIIINKIARFYMKCYREFSSQTERDLPLCCKKKKYENYYLMSASLQKHTSEGTG